MSVSHSGALALHGWLPFNKQIDNYFTFERDASLSSRKTRRHVPGPLSPGLHRDERLFVVTPDAKLLISAGHWDNSLRVYSLAKHKTTQHIHAHTGQDNHVQNIMQHSHAHMQATCTSRYRVSTN